MIKYDHLLGKEFFHGKNDCYGIVREFYRDNYGILLPNYARPNDWWDFGFDMYRERFMKNGFYVLNCHPSEYQIGDVYLMAIQSPYMNHAGIIVENGQMLHHLGGQISTVTPYRSLFKNTTVAVVRHKDVVNKIDKTEVDILELVPEHIRRKVNEYFEQNPSGPPVEV